MWEEEEADRAAATSTSPSMGIGFGGTPSHIIREQEEAASPAACRRMCKRKEDMRSATGGAVTAGLEALIYNAAVPKGPAFSFLN